MKKLLTTSVLLILAVYSAFAYSLTLGLDTASLQDMIPSWSEQTGQITVDARTPVTDVFELRIPVSVTFNERSAFFESGILLSYHPWIKGPFVALSLIQYGYTYGTTSLEKKSFALNEAMFGWTFAVGDRLSIEPSISLRDPSGIYKDEYSALKGEYPCYRTVRAHLAVCCQVWRNKND